MTAHEPPHLARALMDLGDQLRAERERRERAEAERLELMRAFGAISIAVAEIDGESDNTPWQDVVSRIAKLGAFKAAWDEGHRIAVGQAYRAEQAEAELAKLREWMLAELDRIPALRRAGEGA